MSAPAYVQHSESETSSATASFAPLTTWLTGITQGNLLVMLALVEQQLTTPTGWTQYVNGNTNPFSVAGKLYVFWKVAGSSESAPTISTTSGNTFWEVSTIEYSGADPASPFDGSATIAVTASAATAVVAPAITTTGTDRLVVHVAGSENSSNGGNELSTTPPGGTTFRFHDNNNFTGQEDVIADEVAATATTVSARTFTRSSVPFSSIGMTFALIPAAFTAPFIAATTVVYTPTLIHSGEIEAPFIADTTAVYTASLSGAGTATLTAPFIASTTAVYTPTVTKFTAPFIASTTAVYTPTVRRSGIGAQPVGVNIGFDDDAAENAPTWNRLDA